MPTPRRCSTSSTASLPPSPTMSTSSWCLIRPAGMTRALSVPANVTLVALPPYSPELNPVERVWLYLKERFLSHRLHDDYEAIVNAACKAWRRLTAQASRMHLPLDPEVKTLEQPVRSKLGP